MDVSAKYRRVERPNQVGFVGLGNLGLPMARRLSGARQLTMAFRRSGPVDELSETVEFVDTPVELAARSDLLCVCVADEAQLLEVLDDDVLGACKPGSILIVHSTVADRCCEQLAARSSAHGVAVVDAPVCGDPRAAAAGELILAAGGSDQDIRRCAPLFDTYARFWRHVGPTGAGQRVKILINLLYTANVGLLIETRSLARAIGVDDEIFTDFVTEHPSSGFVGSQLATGLLGHRATLHGKELLSKDVELALSVFGLSRISESVLTTMATSALEQLGSYDEARQL
jgi:3-hydroxyisobutyrate dehydrogenase-like beta-hydroxyacid dehydrogenase